MILSRRIPDLYANFILRFIVMVLDYTLEISAATITAALELPADPSLCPHLNPDTYCSVDVIAANMCAGRYGEGKSIRRGHMHPSMWVVDHIFYRNLFPLLHEQERRGDIMQAIYAVYRKHWFSPASVILQGMHRAHLHISIKGSTSQQLPYPRTITRILRSLHVDIPKHEVRDLTAPRFGRGEWCRSFKRLTQETSTSSSTPTDHVSLEEQRARHVILLLLHRLLSILSPETAATDIASYTAEALQRYPDPLPLPTVPSEIATAPRDARASDSETAD